MELFVIALGKLQKANFGEWIGFVGQLPNQIQALCDKLIHATTPRSESVEFMPLVRMSQRHVRNSAVNPF